MMNKVTNKFENFINTLVDELIEMPDEQVLKDLDPAAVQAEGLRILQAAKEQAECARPAETKAGVSTMKARPVMAAASVTPEEARQFIARATTDGRYMLAARRLGEIPDDEALKLYDKLKSFELDADGAGK